MYHHLIGQLGTTAGSPEGKCPTTGHNTVTILRRIFQFQDTTIQLARDVKGTAIQLKGTKYLYNCRNELMLINRYYYEVGTIK